jgi:hypothetical protein
MAVENGSIGQNERLRTSEKDGPDRLPQTAPLAEPRTALRGEGAVSGRRRDRRCHVCRPHRGAIGMS